MDLHNLCQFQVASMRATEKLNWKLKEKDDQVQTRATG